MEWVAAESEGAHARGTISFSTCFRVLRGDMTTEAVETTEATEDVEDVEDVEIWAM